jgi:hypothetical protein
MALPEFADRAMEVTQLKRALADLEERALSLRGFL